MKKIMQKFLVSVSGKLILALLLDDFKTTLINKVLNSSLPQSSQIIIINFLKEINEQIITDLFNKHNIKQD